VEWHKVQFSDFWVSHSLLNIPHIRTVENRGVCLRVAIEKHIQDRHYNQNVDVVVHRHMDYDNTINARWLKTRK